MKKKKPQKIENILDNILSKHGYKSEYYEAEIIQNWPDIVGDKIAQFTQCTDFQEGILHVRVESSSWRQEITYLKKDILKKIRRETGCKSIKDIRFF